MTILLCHQAAAQELIQFSQEDEKSTQKEILRVAHILQEPHILDSLVDKAVENSPTLKAFTHDQASIKRNIFKEEKLGSSFRIGVNIFSVNTVATQEQSVTTTGVLPNLGVTLAIDPEKFVNRKSYMRQAHQKYLRSVQQQGAQRQTLKVYIMNQYYEYLELLEGTLIKKHILETRQQQYLTAEVSFKNGNTQYDQLMIIQNGVQLAEQDVLKSHIQSVKKRNEIEIILGIR